MTKAAVVDNFDELMKKRKGEPEPEKPKSYIQHLGDQAREVAEAEKDNLPDKPRKLRPLSNLVIIRPDEPDAFHDKEGLIMKAVEYKDKPLEGTVIRCGPGNYLANGTFVKTEVQEGDRVMYRKYSGSPITLADGEMLIMREDEILGVIEE